MIGRPGRGQVWARELHRPGCGCGFSLQSLLGLWVCVWGWGLVPESGETEATLKGRERGWAWVKASGGVAESGAQDKGLEWLRIVRHRSIPGQGTHPGFGFGSRCRRQPMFLSPSRSLKKQ